MTDKIEPALGAAPPWHCPDCGGDYNHTFAECVQRGGMVNGEVEGVAFHISKGSDGVVVQTTKGSVRVRVQGPQPTAHDQRSYSVVAEALDV